MKRNLLIAVILGLIGILLYSSFFSARDLGTITGQVLDQDGNPLERVLVQYSQSERRSLVPIPFGPTFMVRSAGSRITDENGQFTFDPKYEWLDYTGIFKDGYKAESLKSTSISDEGDRGVNTTLWLFKLDESEKNNVVIKKSKSRKLNDLETEFFSITQNEFTSEPTDNSDLEIFPYKNIGGISRPLIIQAVNGGIFCSRNDMTYAPAHGYEPGMILNTKVVNYHWIPCFYRSGDMRIYSRLWLHLSIKKNILSLSIEHAHNNSGSRYIDFDFYASQGEEYLGTFADIERVVPGQKEWWAYSNSDILALITSEERFREIWEEFKNTDVEPYQDSGRVVGHGGLTRIALILANNPLTPPDILSEIAETTDIRVIRALLENPSVAQDDFDKLIKKVHESEANRYLSERPALEKDWEELLEGFESWDRGKDLE